MSTAIQITPAPSPEEAAAITAALGALLAAGTGPAIDPTPAAYHSRWRETAIREGVGLAADDRRTR